MQPAATHATKNAIIFYDGTCGLCHAFVQWTLRHDSEGEFRFAPLQGETFKERVSEKERHGLPDSVIVLMLNGSLATKSGAVKYVCEQIGLRGHAALLGILPRWLADFGYDLIARTRYAIFGRRKEKCPLVSPDLRTRFLD